MYSTKFKQVLSVALMSSLLITSAMPAFATNSANNGRGIPEHVIEKQEQKMQDIRIKRDEVLQRQEVKRAEILQKLEEKRTEVRSRYTNDELESLNKNMKNMKEQLRNVRVMPFDSVVSNRKNIKFDTPPVIKGGRTLVPLRAISEGFKADVEWNGETREATITKGETQIVIKIDSNIVLVNGEEVEIDALAEIMSSRTYVPLRFIAETLGIKVGWDPETETIELNEELEVLKKELQEELLELEEELETLNNDYIENLRDLEEEFTGKIEQLEKSIEEMEADLEEKSDDELQEIQELVEEIEAEIASLKNEYIEEKNKLEAEFTEEIEKLEEKTKEIESELEEIIQEIEKIKEEETEEEQ